MEAEDKAKALQKIQDSHKKKLHDDKVKKMHQRQAMRHLEGDKRTHSSILNFFVSSQARIVPRCTRGSVEGEGVSILVQKDPGTGVGREVQEG